MYEQIDMTDKFSISVYTWIGGLILLFIIMGLIKGIDSSPYLWAAGIGFFFFGLIRSFYRMYME